MIVIILLLILKGICTILLFLLFFGIAELFFKTFFNVIAMSKNNKNAKIKELLKNFNLTHDEANFIINDEQLYKTYQNKLINKVINTKKDILC